MFRVPAVSVMCNINNIHNKIHCLDSMDVNEVVASWSSIRFHLLPATSSIYVCNTDHVCLMFDQRLLHRWQ
jgi:hypothetical protein